MQKEVLSQAEHHNEGLNPSIEVQGLEAPWAAPAAGSPAAGGQPAWKKLQPTGMGRRGSQGAQGNPLSNANA